jgi:hypothetical protein
MLCRVNVSSDIVTSDSVSLGSPDRAGQGFGLAMVALMLPKFHFLVRASFAELSLVGQQVCP